MNYSIVNLWNPGVLRGQVPPDIFKTLRDNCSNGFVNKKYNDQLVANIKDEFHYPYENHPELRNFLIEMYNQWRVTFGWNTNLGTNQYPDVHDMWVNFQRKGEYNPNHSHGGDVSFVIWTQIPYDIEEELKVDYYKNSQSPLRKAAFEFTYQTMNYGSRMATFWINKHDEGTIFMFPSSMIHCVYPFTTSDGVRISVAGNMVIKMHE
jgi:hypothetical protein